MAGLNKAIVLGNLGRDPEVRSLNNGGSVANLSIATSESYKKDGEKVTQTEWHRVVVFQNTERGLVTDVIQKYLSKGDQVMVEGQLRTRKWADQEGNDRYSTEIVLSGPKANLVLIGGGRTSSNETPAAPETVLPDDDLPF